MTPPTRHEKRRLKYAATINDEALSESTEPDFELKYIDIGNVRSDGKIDQLATYRFENAPSRARRVVRHGDVIVSTVRTYLQAIAPIENPDKNLIVSTGFAVVRPRAGVLDSSYCKYALREPIFLNEVVARSVGVSYPAINASDLSDISIDLHPLETQETIAHVLDRETSRIDALIAAKERLLELLAEKRRALITRAVTKGLDPNVPMRDSGLPWLGEIPRHWEIQRLKYIVEVELSNVDKHSVEGEQGVLLCNYMDVYKHERITSEMNFMQATATSEQISRLSLLKSDVIITKDSETPDDIGVPAIVAENLDGVVCGYHLAVLRPHSSRILSEFLFRAIQAESTKNYFFMEAVGMTRWGLGKQSITDLPVPLPSVDEQDVIVRHINQELSTMEYLNATTERTISLLRERRSALIAAAVTGKTDVMQMEPS